MTLSVNTVPPESLDAVWPSLEPMIKRGLKHGQGDCDTVESMKEAVRSGDRMLWVAHKGEELVAGMILRLAQYPAKRIVFVEMVAGRGMKDWLDEAYLLLEKFRIINNADTIEASCRGGMAKFLEQRGWSRKAVIMRSPT